MLMAGDTVRWYGWVPNPSTRPYQICATLPESRWPRAESLLVDGDLAGGDDCGGAGALDCQGCLPDAGEGELEAADPDAVPGAQPHRDATHVAPRVAHLEEHLRGLEGSSVGAGQEQVQPTAGGGGRDDAECGIALVREGHLDHGVRGSRRTRASTRR